MPSSRQFLSAIAGASAALMVSSVIAAAQPLADGYAVERYYPSAPGAGWLVMDHLDLYGKLGGGVTLTTGYARNPYSVAAADGSSSLHVVSNQAFVDVGMAVFYDRYRISLNIADPLYASGNSGTVAGHEFSAPSVDPGKYPDKVTDVRLGFDARLLGDANGPLRIGLGAQLWVPSGERSLYATDGTLRAMFRTLVAGDFGMFTYAGQLGVHVRPLDESPVPGAPRGSELLFGMAAGSKFAISRAYNAAFVLGPEVFGETAFHSPFGKHTSGVEALLTGRLQRADEHGARETVKLGFGEGIHAQFGAPDWRAVVAVEIYDRVR